MREHGFLALLHPFHRLSIPVDEPRGRALPQQSEDGAYTEDILLRDAVNVLVERSGIRKGRSRSEEFEKVGWEKMGTGHGADVLARVEFVRGAQEVLGRILGYNNNNRHVLRGGTERLLRVCMAVSVSITNLNAYLKPPPPRGPPKSSRPPLNPPPPPPPRNPPLSL